MFNITPLLPGASTTCGGTLVNAQRIGKLGLDAAKRPREAVRLEAAAFESPVSRPMRPKR
jgi:hypothetical protein